MLWAEGIILDPNDPALGLMDGSITVFTVGVTAVEIAGPSEKRVGLIIMGDVTNSVSLGNTSSVTKSTGLPLSTNNNILEIYMWRHGKLVQKPWYAIAGVANLTVGVIEIMRQ